MWRDAVSAINRTNFEHAFYGVAMQLGTLALFGWLHFYAALAAGSMLGVGFFIGREHAQAEKRLQKQGVENTVWAGFDVRLWDWDSRWDLIFPTVAVSLMALAILAIH